MLGIHDGGIYIGEDLEFIRHADVVTVGGYSVRDDPLAHLTRGVGFDHLMLGGHFGDPVVGFESHVQLLSYEELW